jgi:tRNA A37 threonylcarbamoyladenosine dehydratase
MQKDLLTEQLSHTSDAERRFGGLERLYGAHTSVALQHAHVAVVGIGGVGSWAAEALARSGVGALTLIDLDHVAESNINRQVHALTETLGQSKIAAMAQRIQSIHPDCRLTLVDDFLTPDNVQQLLPVGLSVVLDCTDQVPAKIAMVLQSRARQQALIVCGGAGGKTNSLALQVGDLAQTTHDALLARVRNILRRDHRFARASNAAGKAHKRVPKMGVRVLWVDQPTRLPEVWQQPAEGQALQGLSCAGYGSTVTVTAAMGFAAAAEAVNTILSAKVVAAR